MRERKREKRGGKGWLGWLVGGYLGLEEEEEEEEGVKAVVVSPFPPFLALLFSPSLKPPPPPATNEREVRSRRRQFLFFSSNPPTNIFFLSGGGSDASSYSGSIFCLPKVWGERGLFLGLHFQVYNKNYSALFPGPGKRGGIQYIFWTKIIWDSFFLKGSLVGFWTEEKNVFVRTVSPSLQDSWLAGKNYFNTVFPVAIKNFFSHFLGETW